MFWLLIAWYQQNNIRFRNLAQYTRETYTIRLGVRLTGLVLGRSPAGFVQKFANQFFRPERMLCSCQISFNLIFSQNTQLQNKLIFSELSYVHNAQSVVTEYWQCLMGKTFSFIWLVIWYSWVWKKKYLLLFCKKLGKSPKICTDRPFFWFLFLLKCDVISYFILGHVKQTILWTEVLWISFPL